MRRNYKVFYLHKNILLCDNTVTTLSFIKSHPRIIIIIIIQYFRSNTVEHNIFIFLNRSDENILFAPGVINYYPWFAPPKILNVFRSRYIDYNIH